MAECVLQGPLMYESIGIYPAQTFFSVNRNGSVIINRSLKEDSIGRDRYTLRVIVYDSGDPKLQDTADVTIFVQRNPNAPRFTEFSYSRQINEEYPLGEDVLTVSAVDDDNVSELLAFMNEYKRSIMIFAVHIYSIFHS